VGKLLLVSQEAVGNKLFRCVQAASMLPTHRAAQHPRSAKRPAPTGQTPRIPIQDDNALRPQQRRRLTTKKGRCGQDDTSPARQIGAGAPDPAARTAFAYPVRKASEAARAQLAIWMSWRKLELGPTRSSHWRPGTSQSLPTADIQQW
jgi:hypothetical protein